MTNDIIVFHFPFTTSCKSLEINVLISYKRKSEKKNINLNRVSCEISTRCSKAYILARSARTEI